MDKKQFEGKIREVGRPIICGPNESCKMRVVKVVDDKGSIIKATAWGRKSEDLHVGSNVLIRKMPPINPLSKIEGYEVFNKK